MTTGHPARRPRVRWLLPHAHGRDSVVRATVNQADALVAAGWDVELVSAVQHRDEPRSPLDPQVRVATVDERQLTSYLGTLSDGILITTSPALSSLAAEHATGGVIRVAREHNSHGTHEPEVQRHIRKTYPLLDAVTVPTEPDREEYARLLPGTRVVRIPNAVRSLDQVPSDPRSKIAVAAGRLLPRAGFDLLIAAWAKLVRSYPDWRLRIYGSGEQQTHLRALIEQHHLYNHVFLMGHTGRLDDELAKASVYVVSSRCGGGPMAMVEAMSHALPVVAFDTSAGPSEVLTHGGDGLLVPPEDPDALAEALGKLMGDRALRAGMGVAAAMTAASYRPDAVRPRWSDLFTELYECRVNSPA